MQWSIIMSHRVQRRAQQAAAAAMPREACGLVVGRCVGRTVFLDRLICSPNMAKDPETTFVIHPKVQFRLNRLLRSTVYRVLGVFHSHPTGLTQPSATDRALAAGSDLFWLISDGSGCGLRIFSLENSVEIVEYPFDLLVE